MNWFGLFVGGVVLPSIFVLNVWSAPWGSWLNRPWVWGALCLVPLAALGLSLTGQWRLAAVTRGYLVAVLGSAMAALFAIPGIVVLRAEAIADGSPYCIQTASQINGSGYVPAQSLFDLSAAKMQARIWGGGSTYFLFQHHAILIVSTGENTRKHYNWTYRKMSFTQEVSERELGRYPKMVCRPQVGFASGLPWVDYYPSVPTAVVIGNTRLQIPKPYEPVVNEDATPRALNINARPPDFSAGGGVVVITEAPAGWLERLWRAGRDWRDLGSLDKPVKKPGDAYYVKRDGTGRGATVIECWRGRCSHVFERDGWLFRFTYRDDLFQEWPAMEDRLVALQRSFAVPPTNAPLSPSSSQHDRP